MSREHPRRRRCFTGALLAGLALAAAASAVEDVPFLSGRVNDYAHLVSDDVCGRLESTLAELETKTGAQVAVLTVDTLGGEPIEDYSMRVVETWKLGQKDKNNGVLVLVAKNDREMRIEVGYGLEGVLTDAQCSRIIAELMRPRFRDGDFGGGIDAAVGAIGGFIRGESPLPAEAPPSAGAQEMPLAGQIAGGLLFTVVVGVFSLLAVFMPGCQSWFLYAFLIPFYWAFPSAFASPAVGTVMLLAWLAGFPIAKLLLGKTAVGRAWVKRHPFVSGIGAASWHSGGSGGGWSSSGGGFSGGGFSGGGGSFGGGGSSGSW